MPKRRVVVTGLGTVNSLGQTVEEFWTGLMEGRSGIRRIERFDASPFTSQIGGEVWGWQGVPADMIDARENKRMDRFSQFAVCAAVQAVRDTGIDLDKFDRDRCGVIIGTGIGGLETLELQHKRMLRDGPARTSPFTVPKLMANAASGTVSILWHLRGPNFAVATACASAANSIGEAMKVISRNEADMMISGGSEAALTPIGLASFCALKGLSTRNDDPQHASRPWDRGRDGFLLSEGSGVIILESLEHARARSARIYAELVGYGASADGHHISAPDPSGEGPSLAMRQALADGGAAPEDVQYINAHGTSTQLGDLAEVRALKRSFGDYARNGLVVSSTKGATGHMLGATGGVEAIATALAIHRGVLPPTLNLEDPDDECDLDFIPHEPREAKVDLALSNSFGFGGHNACLLFKRFAD